MKESGPKIESQNQKLGRDLLKIAGRAIGSSKTFITVAGLVLMAGLLTSCESNREPVIPPDSISFPIHFADDSPIIAGCEGAQSVVLPSGESIQIPTRCGDVYIRGPENGQIGSDLSGNSMGSADGVLFGGSFESDGIMRYVEPTGEISNIQVSSALSQCGQRTLAFKEGELNALTLQFLIESGLIHAIDAGESFTKEQKQVVTAHISDGMAILWEVDSLESGTYCETQDPIAGALLKRLTSIPNVMADGEVTQDELCEIVEDAITANAIAGSGNSGDESRLARDICQ